MTDLRRTKTEFGGFLPLELNHGKEYFAAYEPYLRRFNSVKAGLDYLIKRLGKKRIYIPYYYCPSTTEAIRRTGIEVCFYHVTEDLMPEEVVDDYDSIFLMVDYFGVCTRKVNEFAVQIKKADLIIDRAHGFYERPTEGEHIHNIYSAKKFFGIPDGAYLVSNEAIPGVESLSDSYEYANYLLLAYEEGTNEAYSAKREADKRIAGDYNGMSKLAIGLLQNIDYERVKQLRENNYRQLFDAFKNINELSIPDKSPAYQFPLLIKGKGAQIKKRLIENRIFVSTLWSGKDLIKNGNAFEKAMMDDCVFLPMDQRYDEKDMEYIVFATKESYE